MQRSAIVIRSPALSSMSTSRVGGVKLTSAAKRTSSSVVFPMALTTTTTSSSARRLRATWSATARIRSESATEVPPNFCTTRDMAAQATALPATTLVHRVHREASTPEGRSPGSPPSPAKNPEAQTDPEAGHHLRDRGPHRGRHRRLDLQWFKEEDHRVTLQRHHQADDDDHHQADTQRRLRGYQCRRHHHLVRLPDQLHRHLEQPFVPVVPADDDLRLEELHRHRYH